MGKYLIIAAAAYLAAFILQSVANDHDLSVMYMAAMAVRAVSTVLVFVFFIGWAGLICYGTVEGDTKEYDKTVTSLDYFSGEYMIRTDDGITYWIQEDNVTVSSEKPSRAEIRYTEGRRSWWIFSEEMSEYSAYLY